MYEDPNFPASESSLGSPSLPTEFFTSVHSSITWHRLSEISPKPLELFHKIDPRDILQGNLGDCYLLSAISALAEYPNLIKRLFYTQSISPIGKYTIGNFHNGIWTIYDIDDNFPFIGGNIAFSGPRFEDDVFEIWVLLLEKLWAKRHGGYFNIENGLTEHALRDLTGAPCERISTSIEGIWEIIDEANNKKHIITASSSVYDASVGLIPLHAYTVIDTRFYQDEELLLIRNPWGKYEFTGDWSDESDKWTPKAKADLNWQAKDDGCFWMNSVDFVKYFESITLCLVEESYKYTHILSSHNCFKVTQHSAGPAYYNITQEYAESPVRIIVANAKGYICGKSGIGKDVWIKVDTIHEDYFVYTERTHSSPIVFSVYCEANVAIEEYYQTSHLIHIWNLDLVKKHDKCRSFTLYEGIIVHNLELLGENNREFREGFVVDYIENTMSDKAALIEVMLAEAQNVEFVSKNQVFLNPGKSDLIMFKQVDLLKEYGFRVEIRAKFVPPKKIN